MRITKSGRDGVRARGRADGRARGLRRWLWPGLTVLAFLLGLVTAYAPAHDLVPAARPARWAYLAAHPRLALHVVQARNAVPTLTLDVAMTDYQRLIPDGAELPSGGPGADPDAGATRPAASERGCVTAQASLAGPDSTSAAGDGPVAVALCAIAGEAAPGRYALEVAVAGGAELLGVRWARLRPAGTLDTLLDARYLATAEAYGLPVAHAHLVRLVINGSARGLYRLEAIPSTATLVAAEGGGSDGDSSDERERFGAGSAIISFSAPRGARGYAQARVGAAPADTAMTAAEVYGAAVLDADAASPTAAPTAPGAADARSSAAASEALARWRALERGEVALTARFDLDALATYLALMTFWYGSDPAGRPALYLVYDPATERFTPLPATSGPGVTAALPVDLVSDPAVQRAYVRRLGELRDAPPEALLGTGVEAAAQAGLMAQVPAMTSPAQARSAVVAHQRAVAAHLAPAQTVWAEVADGEGGLLVRLETALPLPVEVVGLEFGEAGFVPVERAWIAATSRSALLDEASGVVLRERRPDAPVAAVIELPAGAIPTARDDLTRRLRVVTRVWGADEEVAVPVTSGAVSTWGE